MPPKYPQKHLPGHTQGRHYSGFWPFCRIAPKQYQCFGRLKKVKSPKSRVESAKFG